MLKFPSKAPKNKDLNYANSCISEYIGCHIFDSVGITAQETILGVYRKGGVEKIVVACKDFTSPGIVLQDFASLKNTVINSSHNGYGTELTGIMQAMDEQAAFSPTLLKQYFWDVFIVDALIGNWNRHNGNWGFLYNTTSPLCMTAAAACIPKRMRQLCGPHWKTNRRETYGHFHYRCQSSKSITSRSTTLILFPR